MPAKKEISLLPNEENLNTFSARFLRWVTSVGRVVIVFVELIVIGAFLKGMISFLQMSEVIEQTMAKVPFIKNPTIEDHILTNEESRIKALEIIKVFTF